MSRGGLKLVGTSEYIKKNFGIGYHLTLEVEKKFNFENDLENFRKKIQENVCKIIPNAKQNMQTQGICMKFILPFEN